MLIDHAADIIGNYPIESYLKRERLVRKMVGYFERNCWGFYSLFFSFLFLFSIIFHLYFIFYLFLFAMIFSATLLAFFTYLTYALKREVNKMAEDDKKDEDEKDEE